MPVTKISWDNYRKIFFEEAVKKNYSVEEIENFLDYANNLYVKNIPIIYDFLHLCLLVGYNRKYIERTINNTGNFYRYFSILKKNGGKREISEPLPSLKEIQNWILNEILYKIEVSKFSKAYIKGSSIKNNAKFHKNQNTVLSIDIRDYFDCIDIKTANTFFSDIGYDDEVANALSSLCCLDGSLPQGAPTSPYLSNLLTVSMDEKLGALARNYNVRYTRYADDITFSGSFEVGLIINKTKQILSEYGFEINDKKTRAQSRSEQQLVTGIVVNTKKLQVPKTRRKKLRQEIYYIQMYGLENHLIKCNITKQNFLKHLLGTANYILHINPKDSEVLKSKDIIIELIKRE